MSARKQRNDIALKRTARQLTSYRAALVAISSIEKCLKVSENVDHYVRLNIQMIRLQAACMEAESNFFIAFQELDQQTKCYIVMQLIDRDGDGRVNLRELARAFHKMDRTKPYAKSVEDANSAIEKADKDQDGMLNIEEFESFMDGFVVALKCSFDELCFLLIQWLAFNQTGEDIIREALRDNNVIDINETKLSEYEDEILETRIALLFQSLDFDGSGKVRFIDLVERIYDISKTVDESTRNLLFAVDDAKNRKLNYTDFTTLLLNIAAVTPEYVQFDAVADAMTFAGTTPESINSEEVDNFIKTLNTGLTTKEKAPKFIQHERISAISYVRIQKLFQLYDTNGLGCIQARNAIASIRKLEGASRKIDNSIQEVTSNIVPADSNNDHQLNAEEYTILICSVASALEIDVNGLVSYLIVQRSLRNDERREKIYLNKMKGRVVQKIKDKEEYTRKTWNWLENFWPKGSQ
eukprot:CAMPEP_0194239254 /NCGR_PEP_ID=MMETSP0158-20130606/5770_1 /TAXON_ID=33649 /ORGANISM="Thalassionema nitzschioides, Strain L26-B" /LENGTH=466 /DNA_ID=CAMNT_0038973687 /DNA_START=73 /DNA_END=1473 /DNA_ORIENTATION=+